jgi:hypothetical protein
MPEKVLPSEEARRIANIRHSRTRGRLPLYLNSVINRAALLTDDERLRLAAALVVTRSRSAQGLPDHIEDPSALQKVSDIVAKAP